MVSAPESTRRLKRPCANTALIFSKPSATSRACFSEPSLTTTKCSLLTSVHFGSPAHDADAISKNVHSRIDFEIRLQLIFFDIGRLRRKPIMHEDSATECFDPVTQLPAAAELDDPATISLGGSALGQLLELAHGLV